MSSDLIIDEYTVQLPGGQSKGWAVGARPDSGYDWMAYGPENGKVEFEFGACPGDETPGRAIKAAEAEYQRRFAGA